jgi:hypothetical protein
MIRFLRISSIYPLFAKQLNKKKKFKNLSYEKTLDKVFEEDFSISNNITVELKKKNYECFEIIENLDFLQKKWFYKYGKNKSNRNILIQQIEFYKPNVILLGNTNLASNNFIEQIRNKNFIKLILCFHCAPLNKKIINNFKNIDNVITCTEGYKTKINALTKKKTLVINHAFNNKYKVSSIKYKRDIDIVFIGSLFISKGLHIGRIETIYELLKGFENKYVAINFSKYFLIHLVKFVTRLLFDSSIRGKNLLYKLLYIYFFSKKPIFGSKMYEILNKSKILINMHIEDTVYAGNMRLFEGTGCGCLLLTDNKKKLNRLFNLRNELVVYYNKNDLLKKINYYLKYPSKLNRIAKSGKKKTFTQHNYQCRVTILDKFIKKSLKK